MAELRTKAELADFIKDVVKSALQPYLEAKAGALDLIAAIKEASAPKIIPANKGLMVGRLIRAVASTKGMGGGLKGALDWVVRTYPGDAETLSATEKALSAGNMAGGGFIVPPEYSSEIIEFLRPRAVVRKMNAMVLPMERGTLMVPKVATGATAAYIGENSNANESDQAFGMLTLTAHKLAVFTPLSNDLIRWSAPSADMIVRNDLVAAMAVREDKAFIRDDGTANTPKGLRYWAPAVNVIAANATVNLQNIAQDLSKLILALKNANVNYINPGWLFAPRTEQYLMTIQTTTGAYAFRDEMLTGKLWGLPYATTTQIPTNLSASGDASEVYLVDFSDAVIAESEQIMLDVSTEAAYFSSSSATTVTSAFQQDQTVIRALALHDFGMRHDYSVAVLTGVKWF